MSNPDPDATTGLEPGTGVPPGETPPTEGSMSGATGRVEDQPNMGPVSGNRTPMVITLTALGIIVLMCAVFIVASLVAS